MAKRWTPSLVLFSLCLAVATGCAKSGSRSSVKLETPPSPNSALRDPCAPESVNAMLAEITRDESAKTALETTAKASPEKTNFRKLYDSEVAFASATEDKLTRLTSCAVAAQTLTDIKNKVAKSRANVTYLSESFPDFK